jgi:3',5'-cyclic AMP phosphodiesterase CpdA
MANAASALETGLKSEAAMRKIIVFTDTHMEPDVADGKLHPDVQLAKGIEHVNAHNGDADLVVFCGDLTDVGDIKSYQMLQARLQDLRLPYKLLLGNHDRRDNFLSVFEDAETDRNGFVQQVIDMGDLRLILLDTLNAPPYDYPKSHMGRLCEKRLAWLDEKLEEAAHKPCIIFMHHPPHDTGFVGMDIIKLLDGEAFYEVATRYGNLKHIVCGHVHRTISGSHRGVPFSVFKSTVGQMPMIFDVASTSVEVNEPSAYGILFADPQTVLVQTEDFELTDLSAVRKLIE